MKTLYYKFMAFVVVWILRLLPKNTPVVFKGSNSSLILCEQLSLLGLKKAIIVTDNFLAGSGILDGIKQKLEETGVEYTVFDGILPDPSFDQVQAGEAHLRMEACDAVIAVGGGSVLDAAKMISILHTNPGDLKSFDGIQKSKKRGLPLFAIPTTAGTGSEVTVVAVITDQLSHKKIPVIDGKLLPSYIALDAEIMKGMPPGITAATGMDALTHAVEAYLSKGSTQVTDSHAKVAITLIFKHLARAWENGEDLESRDAMAMAAFYAGLAFGTAGVGYVHAIAHQLGRVCHTPHGNANAMVLPEVLNAYGSCINPRLAELARLTGVGEAGDNEAALARAFIQAITDLRTQLELPLKPKELPAGEVSVIVEDALSEAGKLYPVPRYLSEMEISGIVRRLLPSA